MENSIENIWKQGFLNEKSLVAPKINDLYNQKSIHLIDKMKRLYKIQVIITVNAAILIPVTYYLMDATWQGLAFSLMLLLTLWYGLRQNRNFKTLNYGATSLEYLRSFDHLLTDRLSKSEKIFRFSYPLYFLIATSAAWSVWSSHGITQKMAPKISGPYIHRRCTTICTNTYRRSNAVDTLFFGQDIQMGYTYGIWKGT